MQDEPGQVATSTPASRAVEALTEEVECLTAEVAKVAGALDRIDSSVQALVEYHLNRG